MQWQMSHRAELRSRLIADRHYNRQKIGSPQFVPPGRCIVLYTGSVPDQAFWVTSYPFAQYVKHQWGGAWVCSAFRNENAGRASDLIRDALAATRHYFGEPPPLGMVSFIDSRKVRPVKVRGKNIWGYSWLKAGFRHVGYTKKDNLMVFQILPEAMPPPQAALSNNSIDLIRDPVIAIPVSTILSEGTKPPMSTLSIALTVSLDDKTLGLLQNVFAALTQAAQTPVAAPPLAVAPVPLTPVNVPSEAQLSAGLTDAAVEETARLDAELPPEPAPVQAAMAVPPPAGTPPVTAPGRRGRVPDSPEVRADKLATKKAGLDYKTEFTAAEAAGVAYRDWLARKLAPVIETPPPAPEPRVSILKSQPGPGESTTLHLPNGNGAAMPAPPSKADDAAKPALPEVQATFDELQKYRPGLAFGILRGVLPGRTDIWHPKDLPAEHYETLLGKLHDALPQEHLPALLQHLYETLPGVQPHALLKKLYATMPADQRPAA